MHERLHFKKLTVPEPFIPAGSCILPLLEPTKKMSNRHLNLNGGISLRRRVDYEKKMKRAVTDSAASFDDARPNQKICSRFTKAN